MRASKLGSNRAPDVRPHTELTRSSLPPARNSGDLFTSSIRADAPVGDHDLAAGTGRGYLSLFVRKGSVIMTIATLLAVMDALFVNGGVLQSAATAGVVLAAGFVIVSYRVAAALALDRNSVRLDRDRLAADAGPKPTEEQGDASQHITHAALRNRNTAAELGLFLILTFVAAVAAHRLRQRRS